nr:MAG TPA: hypothetical protein [Caudoviricetes sp.]
MSYLSPLYTYRQIYFTLVKKSCQTYLTRNGMNSILDSKRRCSNEI